MKRPPPTAESIPSMPSTPSALTALHDDIDARVAAIRATHAEWPCAKGCDACCRRLAAVPQLTAGEWEMLRDALAALPAPELDGIARRVLALAALAAAEVRAPVTCPLLDETSGACPVYAQRPVACRSYGYYAQRDGGLYCGAIDARVAAGRLDGVIWGNHDAIDRRLAQLGETRALTDWFAPWHAHVNQAEPT